MKGKSTCWGCASAIQTQSALSPWRRELSAAQHASLSQEPRERHRHILSLGETDLAILPQRHLCCVVIWQDIQVFIRRCQDGLSESIN